MDGPSRISRETETSRGEIGGQGWTYSAGQFLKTSNFQVQKTHFFVKSSTRICGDFSRHFSAITRSFAAAHPDCHCPITLPMSAAVSNRSQG